MNAAPIRPALAVLSLFVAILCGPASGSADERPLPRVVRLENGLRAVIVEDRAVPLVSVQLWARVGSAQDPPRRAGLAHLLRVALSRHRDLDLRMQALGLRVFDATGRDACLFEIIAPAALLDRVLAAQRERFSLDRIEQDMLDELNRAAIAAAADRGAMLAGRVERAVLARLYPQHPYGRAPGDVDVSLRELTAAEATSRLRRWFAPGNLTLVIVGDAPADVVEQRVRARFADLAWVDSPRPERPPRPQSTGAELAAVDAGADAVAIAWPAPRWGVFEAAQLDVLMQRLCNPVDGALTAPLGELNVRVLGWRRESWRYGGLVTLRFAASPQQAGAIAARVEAALRAVAGEIPPEAAHHRARSLARAALRESLADFGSFARRYGAAEVLGGDVLLADLGDAQLARVTVGDVQAAARRLLDAARVVAPLRRAPPNAKTETVVASSTPSDAAASQPQGNPPQSGQGSEPTELRIAETPSPLLDLRRESVCAGVSLTVARTRDLRRVTVYAVTGARLDDVGEAAGALARAGPANLAGGRFADYLSMHGLRLSPGRDATTISLLGSGPADAADRLLELTADTLTNPAVDDAAIRDALAEMHHVRLYVVGQVDPEKILRDARDAWSAFQPATPAPGPAADAPAGDATTTRGRVAVRVSAIASETGGVSAALRLRLRAPRSMRQRLAADIAARLLRSPKRTPSLASWVIPGDPLRPETAWSLTSPRTDAARTATLAAIEAQLGRLEDLCGGRIAGEEWLAACAAAHHARFCALDGSDAVAFALAEGWDDPWRTYSLDSDEVRRLVRDYLRAFDLTGEVVADAPAVGRLRAQFERLAAAARGEP